MSPDFLPKPWDVRDLGSEVHIVPRTDTGPHAFSRLCPCDVIAEIIEVEGDVADFMMYTHRAFDLREYDEWWYFEIHVPALIAEAEAQT